MLVLEPLSNLLAAEVQLSRSVSNIEDREICLGVDLAADGENAFARRRDKSPSFITGGEKVNASDFEASFGSLTWTSK